MPISSRVWSSAQSSTTTATLASLSRKARGSRRRAEWTSDSNSGRVMRTARLETANALDVDDVLHLADRLHDLLQLVQILDLDHEVVEPLAVVGHRDLGLDDVALPGGDRGGDLGKQARAVAPDVDRNADRPLGRLRAVPLHRHQPLLVEHVLRHREAVARVHGETAAPRDEPDDAVARYRRAALGEADQQVVDPADAHRGPLSLLDRPRGLGLGGGLRVVH